MARRLPCPTCKKKISVNAESCPNCGDPLSEGWAERQGRKQSAVSIISVVLLLIGVGYCSTNRDGGQTPEERQEAEAKRAAEEAENKRRGFHCLSGWDGSHRAVVNYVKDRLRDPDSFEHAETRISPNKEGNHLLIMTYRARNGFGGMSVATVTATVSNATCDATITAASDGL